MRAENGGVHDHGRSFVALIGVVALVVGSIVAPGPAWADAAADAEVLIKKGTELRREGRDREALIEFQRAAAVRDTPRVQAQIALAEQALGSWVEANGHLTWALDHHDDPWIEKNRATLVAAQTTIRAHLAQLEVWGTPADASVELDGALVGKLPSVTTWQALGDVALRVSAPGYTPVSRPLTIQSPTRVREHVELRKLALVARLPQPEAGPGPGATAVAGESATGAVNSDDASAQPAGTPLYREWWFWAALGVLAVGTGTGVYFLTRGSASTCSHPPCDQL